MSMQSWSCMIVTQGLLLACRNSDGTGTTRKRNPILVPGTKKTCCAGDLFRLRVSRHAVPGPGAVPRRSCSTPFHRSRSRSRFHCSRCALFPFPAVPAVGRVPVPPPIQHARRSADSALSAIPPFPCPSRTVAVPAVPGGTPFRAEHCGGTLVGATSAWWWRW